MLYIITLQYEKVGTRTCSLALALSITVIPLDLRIRQPTFCMPHISSISINDGVEISNSCANIADFYRKSPVNLWCA